MLMRNNLRSLVNSVILVLLPACIGYAQNAQTGDSLFLRVVVPDSSALVTTAPRQRIAASTLPNAKAFINGKETRVYASGAFCGIVNVPVGSSVLRLVVRSANGDSAAENILMQRPEPPKTSPKEPISIDTIMMEPSEDIWLGKDGILEVKFKGSPGHKAYFDIPGVESGIAMSELPVSKAGGVGGIYAGSYKVKDDDEARGVQIKFRIPKNIFSSEKGYSKGKVTILPKELPRVAELIGKRPYLNASVGTDRLGGAKLGFLKPGIRVVVTGKLGDQYQVKLGDEMEGWLPEEFAQLLPLETPRPRSLIGALSISGNDKEDIVTVALDQRLPYLSQQLVDPAAIVVDIFGATSNTNWITHQLSGSGIKNVTWSQAASGQYRLTIALNYQQHWGYDINYDNGSTMRISVRRPPVIHSADSAIAGLIIAVDAGHGGDNDGAIGATGRKEKEITLSVAQHLDTLLRQKGAKVVMTRTTDETVSMTDRTDKILSSGAQLLVSIHANSASASADPDISKGTSAYYRHIGFAPLAEILYGKMLELGLDQFGVVGSFNFNLNSLTQTPNALVETAFMSNPEDEMLLLDDNFRSRIAGQIEKGIEEFVVKFGERKK